MEKISLRDVLAKKLVELGGKNEQVVVLDADLATSTKVDEFAKAFPERFFEVGIAEQNMVGMAAGLATLGFIPFTSSFACFTAKRALDQIRITVAQPKLNVKLLGAYTGLFTGKTGKTHQSVQDIAIMRTMPNMRVVAPGDAIEMSSVLEAVIEYVGPVYIRIPRDPISVFLPKDYKFQWGKPITIKEGRDLTLISTGEFTEKAIEVAAELEKEFVHAKVIHLPSLKPIDEDAIARIALESSCIITIENHNILGGLGGAIAEIVSERSPTLIKRIGIKDVFGESASNEDLLNKYGLSTESIKKTCLDLLNKIKR